MWLVVIIIVRRERERERESGRLGAPQMQKLSDTISPFHHNRTEIELIKENSQI